MAGPTYTGIPTYFLAPSGVSVALFADTVVNDALPVIATITLSYPTNGALSDPSATSDGSSYDNATGTYVVSGTAAQVTAALQGLLFASPSPSYGGPENFTVNLSDASPSSVSASFYGDDNLLTTYSGGGRTIVAPNFSPAVKLVDTLGDFDAVSTLLNPYVVVLDNAQAKLSGEVVVWLEGSDDKADFNGSGAWDAVFGNNGDFTLDDASLSVSGADAQVQFSSTETHNAVSFYGPSTGGEQETVVGSDGQIIENYVDVAVTGDNELIYFNASADTLDLTAATAGAWSTLFASSGSVDLNGASLSIVGGGVSVDAVSGDDAASLYQTAGVADNISGDDVTLTLNNAQAVVSGTGDAIWLVGGSGSTATLNLGAGQSDRVYGAGTIDLNGGAVSSVGGGALVDFVNRGGTAYLSDTEGVWDQINGAGGITSLSNAQAVVYGGNQTVYVSAPFFGSQSDDAVTLARTGGNWDSLFDPPSESTSAALLVDGAQVNVFGSVDGLTLTGTGAQVSLYDAPGSDFSLSTVTGSNSTIIVNIAVADIVGGNDTVFLATSSLSDVTLVGGAGAWDTVYEQDTRLNLDGPPASVIGGGNVIECEIYDAVSLYGTNGLADTTNADAVTLNDAQANVQGQGRFLYFGPGDNSANLEGYKDDLLTFVGAFGRDTIQNLGPDASIALSHTEFANYQAFEAAFTQQGDDAVLTLDADDKVTFVGLQTSAVTASQVKFV